MSIVSCSECRNKISSYAKQCPKCGAPVDVVKINMIKKDASKIAPFFWTILLVFLIFIIYRCNDSENEIQNQIKQDEINKKYNEENEPLNNQQVDSMIKNDPAFKDLK